MPQHLVCVYECKGEGGLCCPKGAVRITSYNLPDALVFITAHHSKAPNGSDTILPEQAEMACMLCNRMTVMSVNK